MHSAGRPTGRVSGVYGALVREGAYMGFRTGWCSVVEYDWPSMSDFVV